YPVYIKDEASGEWSEFLPQLKGRCRGVFSGDYYIAIVTEHAPRGRLMAIPVHSPQDRSTWRELMPQSQRVMWTLSWTGVQLLLTELEDALVQMHLLSLDGTGVSSISLPGPGAVGTVGPARSPGSDIASASA